jgi:hypothetical protein
MRATVILYLTNPAVWSLIAASIAFAFAARQYLRYAARLVQLIDNRYPDIWPKLFWTNFARKNPMYQSERGRRIEQLVMGWYPCELPKDAELAELLNKCRATAAGFVASLALAIIATGFLS